MNNRTATRKRTAVSVNGGIVRKNLSDEIDP
jgi:hypothetical protein